jgi:hypothetical protein
VAVRRRGFGRRKESPLTHLMADDVGILDQAEGEGLCYCSRTLVIDGFNHCLVKSFELVTNKTR